MLGSWVESVSEILKRNLRQRSLILVTKRILFSSYIHESVVFTELCLVMGSRELDLFGTVLNRLRDNTIEK